tara:strand:+ start:135 stop:290 length:156 start_codon:yes stop_codon:yes gene_type:complete
MKMSVFSLAGWIVAGGAVTLFLCGSLLMFVGGYTVGESVCGPASSGRLLGP